MNASSSDFRSTPPKTKATAFAPASVANVAVGFDILGFSVDFAGDRVTVEKIPSSTGKPWVEIAKVSGLVTTVPSDPAANTATAGLLRLISDLELPFGFRVSIEKGIPLGSGMGGSAASAVAAIVAANALLEQPLSNKRLIRYALIGEAQASGGYHADNVAPSLIGGLTLSRLRSPHASDIESDVPEVEAVSLPTPEGLYCVVVHPHLSVETKHARGVLKPTVSLHDHVAQSGCLAEFIAACFMGNMDMIGRSLTDLVIEPQRAHLIPGFGAVKRAALEKGALGCSISGAGPSVFAWARDRESAIAIQEAMVKAFKSSGTEAKGWHCALPCKGARLVG